MKYKVGDKVKIVGNQSSHEFAVGTIVEIIGIDGEGYKCSGLDIFENKDFWFVRENDIEPVDYTWEDFLKAPIGTKVTFESGKYIFKIDKDEYEDEFASMRDNFSYEDLENFKIKLSDYGKIIKIEEPTYTTVYEPKEEVKKMTIADLEKELGYKIKVVKEK